MREDQSAKAYVGVIIGFIVQVVGRLIANISNEGVIIGAIVGLGGVAIFVWGCVNLAAVKGYSKWLGLLGLLSCIGLVVLILLPDQSRRRARRS